MRVQIIYATIEGQTGKIAEFAKETLTKLGHDVSLDDVGDRTLEVSVEGADRVLLAASVHERRHPKPFELFLSAQAQTLAQLPTLMLSVSLSAAFAEGMEEAGEYVSEMEMRTGFVADDTFLVAGAIRGSRYDYYATQVVRHVIMRGKEYDPSVSEHEFTDWEALRERLKAFVAE